MPILVTADDITSALIRLDAQAAGIDAGFSACSAVAPVAREQWKAFLDGYHEFSVANKDHSFFALGLPAIGNQTVAYESEMNAWAQVLRAACPKAAPPSLTQQQDVANQNARPPTIATTDKALLIGGGIVALILILKLR